MLQFNLALLFLWRQWDFFTLLQRNAHQDLNRRLLFSYGLLRPLSWKLVDERFFYLDKTNDLVRDLINF